MFKGSDSNYQKCQKYKFSKCLGIWEIFQIPTNISQMTGNFQDTQAFGEFPKYPDILRISQFIWEVSKIFKINHPQIPI